MGAPAFAGVEDAGFVDLAALVSLDDDDGLLAVALLAGASLLTFLVGLGSGAVDTAVSEGASSSEGSRSDSSDSCCCGGGVGVFFWLAVSFDGRGVGGFTGCSSAGGGGVFGFEGSGWGASSGGDFGVGRGAGFSSGTDDDGVEPPSRLTYFASSRSISSASVMSYCIAFSILATSLGEYFS